MNMQCHTRISLRERFLISDIRINAEKDLIAGSCYNFIRSSDILGKEGSIVVAAS